MLRDIIRHENEQFLPAGTTDYIIEYKVMGYYNPLPVLSEAYGMELDAPVAYFNELIQDAIDNVIANHKGASITYVDTIEVMSSSDEYLVPVDIHPTVEGNQAIANEFWRMIETNLR